MSKTTFSTTLLAPTTTSPREWETLNVFEYDGKSPLAPLERQARYHFEAVKEIDTKISGGSHTEFPRPSRASRSRAFFRRVRSGCLSRGLLHSTS